MQSRDWTFVDKASWGAGPWQSEPDKRQWTDAATGYPCLIRRNGHMGFLCGYVGIPAGHVFYEHGYDSVDVEGPHGGLTYAGFCAEGEPEHGICHVTEPGEDSKPWWLGFDCGHWQDLSPSIRSRVPLSERGEAEIYRDVAFVTAECARLAAELHALRPSAAA